MITITYSPNFLRQFNKLPLALQDEAEDRVTLFAQDPRNPLLRTHKLKGHLRNRWSFSVNYRYRILFVYDSKKSVLLIAIGDHSLYDTGIRMFGESDIRF